MKEAAGEANMTVITIVLIGVVAGVGALIVPKILTGIEKKSCCTENGGVWFKNACYLRANCTINQTNGSPSNCTGATITPTCS